MSVICDRYRCTYSAVDIKCSSITDNQSLKLSKVYSSLFVDFHKLLGHLFRRHLVYSSFVYHTVLMQMQLWIVLQKRHFSSPVHPRTTRAAPQFRRPCSWLQVWRSTDSATTLSTSFTYSHSQNATSNMRKNRQQQLHTSAWLPAQHTHPVTVDECDQQVNDWRLGLHWQSADHRSQATTVMTPGVASRQTDVGRLIPLTCPAYIITASLQQQNRWKSTINASRCWKLFIKPNSCNDGGATTSAIHCWPLELLAGWPPRTAGLWVLQTAPENLALLLLLLLLLLSSTKMLFSSY